MKTTTLNTQFFKKNLHLIISTIIIWGIGLLFIGDKTAIKILGDEFGYWTAAAWSSGKDWSDVAALNSYYGYGYGFLLSFILRLPLNPLVEYKLAIVLNIIMLTVVFFIIYHIINDQHLFSNRISSIIALTATLYTGNTFHAQFTMSETLVMMLFWLFILLLYSQNKSYTFYKNILGTILILILYIVHHRMLGVILVGFFCLLYIQLKNKHFHHAVIFILLTAGLLICSEYIKNFYQDTYLASEYTNMLYYNDYSGQVASVKYIFTPKGFSLFVIGFIGKIFYILSSTYLLAGVAFCRILKNFYTYIREKRIPSKGILEVFIFLSVASSIAIATIYLLIYEARFDFLIYGRYDEFFISALILSGLLTIIKEPRINIREFFFLIIIYIIMTLIVFMELPITNVSDCTFINSAGIYDTLFLYNQNIFMVAAKAIILFILVVLFIHIKKQKKQVIFLAYTCLLLSVCWTTSYYYSYEAGTLSWASITDPKDVALADFIQKLDCENKLYYYATEGRQVDHLQFLLEDIPIKCIYEPTQLNNLPEHYYLLTEHSTKLTVTEGLPDYIQIFQSDRLLLWEKIK